MRHLLVFSSLTILSSALIYTDDQDMNDNSDDSGGQIVTEGERWTFKCPHASMGFQKLTVMWQLGDTIWLKIDNGRAIITNRLSQKMEKDILGERVIKISLNNYRYKYFYDETTGDFMMEIDPTDRQDAGMWQCHVNVHRPNGRVEQLSTYGRLGIMTTNGLFSGDRKYDHEVDADYYKTDRIFDIERDNSPRISKYANSHNSYLNKYYTCIACLFCYILNYIITR